MNRVIVIDPKARNIYESQVHNLKDMQEIVGGRIERACITPDGHEIYVNEEGLFVDELYAFRVSGFGTFVGKAYMIGPVDKRGNSSPATASIQDLFSVIKFIGKVVID